MNGVRSVESSSRRDSAMLNEKQPFASAALITSVVLTPTVDGRQMTVDR
jgi:hypothetical protein